MSADTATATNRTFPTQERVLGAIMTTHPRCESAARRRRRLAPAQPGGLALARTPTGLSRSQRETSMMNRAAIILLVLLVSQPRGHGHQPRLSPDAHTTRMIGPNSAARPPPGQPPQPQNHQPPGLAGNETPTHSATPAARPTTSDAAAPAYWSGSLTISTNTNPRRSHPRAMTPACRSWLLVIRPRAATITENVVYPITATHEGSAD